MRSGQEGRRREEVGGVRTEKGGEMKKATARDLFIIKWFGRMFSLGKGTRMSVVHVGVTVRLKSTLRECFA